MPNTNTYIPNILLIHLLLLILFSFCNLQSSYTYYTLLFRLIVMLSCCHVVMLSCCHIVILSYCHITNVLYRTFRLNLSFLHFHFISLQFNSSNHNKNSTSSFIEYYNSNYIFHAEIAKFILYPYVYIYIYIVILRIEHLPTFYLYNNVSSSLIS